MKMMFQIVEGYTDTEWPPHSAFLCETKYIHSHLQAVSRLENCEIMEVWLYIFIRLDFVMLYNKLKSQ